MRSDRTGGGVGRLGGVMPSLEIAGPVGAFGGCLTVNFLVLAYRSARFPRLRSGIDRANFRLTGRTDWDWLTLWHLMGFLLLVGAISTLWNLSTIHCSNDAYALFASGQAALRGGNPFSVAFCGGTAPEQVPYGLAAVSLNALGALTGSVVGVWLVWEVVALSVVPLVWAAGGANRRYLSVLVATSILYLPNITNNIGGLENSIVPVSVLLMLGALGGAGGLGRSAQGIAAFLSTGRFPAIFPLLGQSSGGSRSRGTELLLVLGVFLGSALFAYVLWGGDALQVVYLGQFARNSAESLNLFALLVQEGWVRPSLVVAALQGAALVALLVGVRWRGYSREGSAGILLVGVVLLSQYLNYHFTEWLIPLLLLGATVNWWLLAVGTLMVFDENIAYWYLALNRGVWWPYELLGVVITVLLLGLLVRVVRSEEARRSGTDVSPLPHG